MNLLAVRPFAAVLVALPALVPPMFIVGGAVLGLHTLRSGLAGGLLILGLSLPLVTIAYWALPSTGILVAVYALTLLPNLIVAFVLRQTVSLPLALFSAAAICLLAILMFYALVADPVAFWRDFFTEVITQNSVGAPSPELVAFRDAFPYEAATGLMAGGAFLGYALSLLLGRWWQSKAVNPGGFQTEFHALRFGRGAAALSAAVFIASTVVPGAVFLNLAVIFLLLWAVQGMSVIHGLVRIANAPTPVLSVIYVVLVVGYISNNPVVILVPLIGVVDQFLDFRTLMKNRTNRGP